MATPTKISSEGWLRDAESEVLADVDGASSGRPTQRLRCLCGTDRFEVAGVPRLATQPGGHFMRTLRRAWQEARQSEAEGAPTAPAFEWPLGLRCVRCEREEDLLCATLRNAAPNDATEGSAVSVQAIREPTSLSASASPRENYRCRACRRSQVSLGLSVLRDDKTSRAAVEVIARCAACARVARLAGWDDRPSAQEVELDRLYGRR